MRLPLGMQQRIVLSLRFHGEFKVFFSKLLFGKIPYKFLYTHWIVNIHVDCIRVLCRTFHFCFTLLLKTCVKNLFHLRDSVFTSWSLVPSPLLRRSSFPGSLCALRKYHQMPIFQNSLKRIQYYWTFQKFEQFRSFVVLLQNYSSVRFWDFNFVKLIFSRWPLIKSAVFATDISLTLAKAGIASWRDCSALDATG
jgi:hypothetical protein